jgi:amino acid transporter
LAASAVVYMAVQSVAVGVHPGLAGSERPLADAAALVLGPFGAGLIVAGAVISSVGFNAGAALGGPRYLAALGQLGDMPAWTARVHPRYGTPDAAILLTSGLTLVGALALDFNSLVDVTVVVVCAQYLSTCLAVPLLRRGGGKAGFSLPGGWAIPAVGAMSTLWLAAQGGWAEVKASLILLGAGFLLRSFINRSRGSHE